MEDIDFLVNFVVENSKIELQKLGLEGKVSWALNLFTLGPTAQATPDIVKKEWKPNLELASWWNQNWT